MDGHEYQCFGSFWNELAAQPGGWETHLTSACAYGAIGQKLLLVLCQPGVYRRSIFKIRPKILIGLQKLRLSPKKRIFWPRINILKGFFFQNPSMNYGSSKSAKIVLSKSIFNVKNQSNF